MSFDPTGQESEFLTMSDSLADMEILSAQSTSFVEGFPVRTSPSQDDELASREIDPDSFGSLPEWLDEFNHAGFCSRTFPVSCTATEDETWAPLSERWPTSGTISAGEFSTHDTSESPSDAVECSLPGILEANPDPRYMLSVKAARLVLRSAERRGRNLPVELKLALQSMLATTSRTTSTEP